MAIPAKTASSPAATWSALTATGHAMQAMPTVKALVRGHMPALLGLHLECHDITDDAQHASCHEP